MADFSVSGVINGDSSGFIDAVQQASNALSDFASEAAGVFGGIEAANFFGAITGQISSFVGSIADIGTQFQTFGAVANSVSGSVDTSLQGISDSAASMGGSAAASALEAQDALIKYQEKVQEINDNIATVMQGQNVIDAQTAMYDQLDQLAQNYADKIQSINDQIDQANADLVAREISRQQSMSNTLQDMQDSHENKVADLKESYAQKISLTTSSVEKAKLEKELADKLQLENDSFQRSYDTKQSELQRNLDQQKAADEEATQDKIQRFQSEIDKENKLYAEQVDKVKDASDKKIATLEAENTKKLAMYQRELADEERAYQLSQEKRAAGGGGKGGSVMQLPGLLDVSGPFTITENSAKNLLGYVDQLRQTTPFNIDDIEHAAQQFETVGGNAQKIIPIMLDMSGHFQRDLGSVSQAVFMAMNGNFRSLEHQFGVTQVALEKALGHKPQDANDLFIALQKIDQQRWGDGVKVQGETAAGQMNLLHNQFAGIAIDIMGINEQTGKPVKGGLFEQLMSVVQSLTSFLRTHKKDIEDFAVGTIKFFEDIGAAIGAVAGFFKEHGEVIKDVLTGIGVMAGIAMAIFLVSIGPAILTAAAFGAAVVAAGAVAIAIFGVIGAGVRALLNNWNNIWNAIKATMTAAWTWIQEHSQLIIDLFGGPLFVALQLLLTHFGDLQKGIKTIMDDLKNAWKDFVGFIGDRIHDITSSLQHLMDFAKNALSYLNPFAKHSPSLVDDVTAGVAQIKDLYGSISEIKINTPNLMPAYGSMNSEVYNSYSTNAPNLNMTNNFNVANPANASNVAAYIAYQLEHKGIVY